MDAALTPRPFAGYTLKELEAYIASGRGTEVMIAEVARRKAVAAGDLSVATSAERLRVAQGQKA